MYCKEHVKNLFVGFLDYEKAFDYANRGQIILDLINANCGKAFIQAISKMFTETFYAPKIGKNIMGESISSKHGVTQGRKSSTNLFSFFVSDMGNTLRTVNTTDFHDPYNLAQLADDTAVIAEYFESLGKKFEKVFDYSDKKFQVPNVKKTLYANFAENPEKRPMPLGDHFINSIKDGGYNYLGMLFIATNDLKLIVIHNINIRMKHIAKFYAWLEINEKTPIETKLLVFDNCCLSALLYGCEAWGDISCIEEKLKTVESKVLKRILNVKSGTTNELIFYELKRSNVIAKIKDQQYNFYQKVKQMTTEDTVVTDFLEICAESSIVRYYENLTGNNREDFMSTLNNTIHTSTKSMIMYYRELIEVEKSCIYTSFLNDYYRKVITRWRLSCHSLKIETLRYSRPFVVRENRKCERCDVLEDESHAIFDCPIFEDVQEQFQYLLSNSTDIRSILNPSRDTMVDVSRMLYSIQDVIDDD